MTKQRHCFVTQVGDAIEALASALDPERNPPFKGDILDLLEWAARDVLAMRQELAEHVYWQDQLRQQLQEVCNAIGSPEYMDPPDGGSVTIAEQVSRMREDRDQLRQQLAEVSFRNERLVADYAEVEQQLADRDAELRRINLALNDARVDLTITAAEAITELRQQVTLLRDARRSLKQSTVNGGSERAAWNEGVEAAQSGKKKSDCPYPYKSEEWDYWIDGFRDVVMWQKENFPDTEPKP